MFYKNLFLKTSQNSQENTCVGASFLVHFKKEHIFCRKTHFSVSGVFNLLRYFDCVLNYHPILYVRGDFLFLNIYNFIIF